MSTMTGANTRNLSELAHDAAYCQCKACETLRRNGPAPIKINPPIIPASIDDAFADALSSLWKSQHDLDAVQRQVQDERRRIAGILTTFAASPISASSLQPILDLAAEMNTEAK